MSKKQAILNDVKKVAADLKRTPTRDEYYGRNGRPLGKFTEHTIRKEFGTWVAFIAQANLGGRDISSVIEKEGLEVARLKADMESLLGYIKELEAESVTSSNLRDLIGSIDKTRLGEGADWLKGPRIIRASAVTGIPTLFLSDIHFDEIVKKDEIGGVNEYNHQIACERIKHTFQTTIDLLTVHLHKPKYEGFICALGGDLLSGSIHEELAETNHQTMNQSIFDLADLLITGIGGLADQFGRIFVPAVVGNHGRQHKKPRFKHRVHHNYEWLIYQLLVRHFKKDSRITFLVPDGPDCQWTVYGRTYNLNHGDQFKGGTGIAGLFSPLMLGMARKQKRQNAVGQPFDVMMNGHWHQYIHTDSLIVNGSIKGYDEFASGLNLPYEPPQQALFISHPEKRETFRMPILCDTKSRLTAKYKSPLSW